MTLKLKKNKKKLSDGREYVSVSAYGISKSGTLKRLTDQDRTRIQGTINSLEASNSALAQDIGELNTQLADIAVAPFHTKGLARIEQASYASVTRCNVLDLVIKYEVYRRISGRNNVYGSKQKDYDHSPSDNGAKARTSMLELSTGLTLQAAMSRFLLFFALGALTSKAFLLT
jgi:hypothetical protein